MLINEEKENAVLKNYNKKTTQFSRTPFINALWGEGKCYHLHLYYIGKGLGEIKSLVHVLFDHLNYLVFVGCFHQSSFH